MMALVKGYWPLLLAALLIGIETGRQAFRSRRVKPGAKRRADDERCD